MKTIRNKLKNSEPYLIQRDLLPLLFFKEDNEKTEYWCFFYAFVRRLTDLSIGVRLGYSKQGITRKIKKILENNKTVIIDFLNK